MTRKFIVLITVLALALSLAACTATGTVGGGNSNLNNGAAQTGANIDTRNPDTDALAGNSGDTTPTGELITAEQAQNIALEHAGFTADQVTGLRVEYDVDDGVPEYDVEFHHDRWEYEYEIHAQTGDIRSYDRDD